jgi:hypothetical protein
MEIKIFCSCGAKFKFDVEPVDGHSPGPVHCPSCGKDSTDATNALIHQALAASAPVKAAPILVSAAPAAEGAPKVAIPAIRIPTPASAPAAVRVPSAAPAAIPSSPASAVQVAATAAHAAHSPAPPSAAPAPAQISPKMPVIPVPSTSKQMTVKPPGEATVHEAPPSAQPVNASGSPGAPGSPKMAFMPVPAGAGTALSVGGGHGKKDEANAAATSPPPLVASHPAAGKIKRAESSFETANYSKGVMGGIIGAVIGAVVVYFLEVQILRFALFLWIIGFTAGLGAIKLGKGTSQKLGVTTAIIAGVLCVLTQLLIISSVQDEHIDDLVTESYTEEINLAKRAADVKTDEQVKELMADDSASGLVARSLDQISAEAVAKYRGDRLAKLQKFAKGEPSRTKFEERKRTEFSADPDNKIRFRTTGIVVWTLAAISTASKMAAGKTKK